MLWKKWAKLQHCVPGAAVHACTVLTEVGGVLLEPRLGPPPRCPVFATTPRLGAWLSQERECWSVLYDEKCMCRRVPPNAE